MSLAIPDPAENPEPPQGQSREELRRPKALVFIDLDGVIRNFIKSGAFHELEQRYHVTYVFHQDRTSEKQGIYTDVATLGAEPFARLQLPRKRMGRWWYLYTVAALRRNRGKVNEAPRRAYVATRIGAWRIRVLDILGLNGIYQVFRALYIRWMGTWEPLEELLRRQKPDVVVYPTILSGHFTNDLVLSCRRLALPTVFIMNSWDNASSKAMAIAFPDRLLVWGEHSKDLAHNYMGMPRSQIISVGAAQFEVYRQTVTQSMTALRGEFGVPRDKKIILYAGNGGGVRETVYLRMLEQTVAEELQDWHIVYRPHPWRGSLGEQEEDFFSIDWKHISMDPSMADFYRRRIYSDDRSMFLADYTQMRRLLELASAVISPLSTVLLEAVLNGRPALMFYPTTDQSDDHNLALVHFRDFIDKTSVLVCQDSADFCPKLRILNDQLQNTNLGKTLRAQSRYFVAEDQRTYGARLCEAIDAARAA